MQTFSMFFSEDAGEKFSKMSDDQFADWKKKNPGASSKADELRKKAAAAMKSSAPDVSGKGGTLAKPGKAGDYKKVLANKAKELAAGAAKKAGGALVKQATRKSDMGKWSQGIKNAPKSSAPDTSGKKKAADFMSEPDDQNAENAQTRRRDREDKRNREIEDEKFKRGQKIKKKVGAVAKFIKNQGKRTVKGGDVSYGSQQSGLRQR